MSQKELADRSGITPAQISRIISGTRGAGEDALIAIARALKLPPETVFRAAGLLPKTAPRTEKLEEVLHALAQLTDEDLETLLAVARVLDERRQGASPIDPPTVKSRKKSPARGVLKDNIEK